MPTTRACTVYRRDRAVVLTADFFTPIVDDPYWFGAIAAANSLSDVYAMGGKPLVALNIAALPGGPEFAEINRQIMQGGIDKMKEAGVAIIGGHTVKDKEPKFGYMVMGDVHPDRILDNTKARPGDALVLTKPIGTGVLSTGIKAGRCSAETVEEFTRSMAMLNRRAGEIMIEIGVSTATDITGFGLIGHLNEVLSASKRTARLHSRQVPVFPEAVRIADMGMVPGGTRANQKNYEPFVEWHEDGYCQRTRSDERCPDVGRTADLRARGKEGQACCRAPEREHHWRPISGTWPRRCRERSAFSWSLDMDALFALFLLGVGGSVGFLSGLLGIGGGIVMFPLLLYVPRVLGLGDIDVKSVTGLTMVQGFFSALAALFYYHKNALVNKTLVLTLGLSLFLSSLAGSLISKSLPDRVLLMVFGTLAMIAAVMMLIPRSYAHDDLTEDKVVFNKPLAAGIGVALGFTIGLVGQGGAFILIPVMLYVLRIPLRVALGSTLAIGLFSSSAGIIGKVATGQVPYLYVVPLLVGAIPSARFGSIVGRNTKTQFLKWLLAALIAATAVKVWMNMP